MACFYTIGMGNVASLWEDVLALVSRLYPACVPRMISMRTDREKEGKECGMKGILDGPASLNVVEVVTQSWREPFECMDKAFEAEVSHS
jgi:hypothetical protein